MHNEKKKEGEHGEVMTKSTKKRKKERKRETGDGSIVPDGILCDPRISTGYG